MNFLTISSQVVSQPSWAPSVHEPTDRPFTNSASSATNELPAHEVESYISFDADAALARVGGDRNLLRRMAGLFAIQWNSLCLEIVNAGKNRDSATLELTANKLKRSVESFGAARTMQMAQDLETRGRAKDFQNVEKTCARLQIEIEQLVSALKSYN